MLRAEGARIDGIGVMLGRLDDGRYLVGNDFDLRLSPVTGRVEPWAKGMIGRLATYTEVSPSGTSGSFGTWTGIKPRDDLLRDGSCRDDRRIRCAR